MSVATPSISTATSSLTALLSMFISVSFQKNGDAEIHREIFGRLLAERKIVKRGAKPEAKLCCEMAFDMNTSYLDEKDGYEYAKKFLGKRAGRRWEKALFQSEQ